ncbi:cytochrome P450 3A21 [Nephila pilipes]|uniref:Cytochrome P450 3A21 n=1 Tax=Nephila pilipes TaxID=299642 RepID=A0A8X6P916_NEPPI|nr:cytochrome P450 3A21 [Nephila pilipes]
MEYLLDSVITTFLLGITSLLFLYWYTTRNFDYWKKRGVIYSKPVPFFGSTIELLWKPFHEIEDERYIRFGTLYGHFEGNNPVLSVADPKLLREILVKEFSSISSRRFFNAGTGNPVSDSMLPALSGDAWRRVRNIITPTFTTGKIKRMMSIVKDCSKGVVDNFKTFSANGKHLDMKKMYGAFTMDVIASAAFSTKVDSLNDPENEFVKAGKNAFSTDFSWRFALFQLFPNLMKALRVPIFPPDPIEFFKRVTIRIIEERKRTGQTRNDFLQLLIDTAKEVSQDHKQEEEKADAITAGYEVDGRSQQPVKTSNVKNLSEDEMVAQCVIFFLAGYDTTASALSYASYLLALNPEVQDKLFAEIRDTVKEAKGELSYEAIQEMKYLDNVIAETLRIYPPVIRLERVADADLKLADTGITIPKGMIVTIPNYALQKDPKYFPNPDVFDPDRFTVEERAKRDPYTYLPFGAGPRNCVGMRFALMEIKVCLVYIVSNFKLLRCTQTKVPLDFHLGPGLLIPYKGIQLKVEPRDDKIVLK